MFPGDERFNTHPVPREKQNCHVQLFAGIMQAIAGFLATAALSQTALHTAKHRLRNGIRISMPRG